MRHPALRRTAAAAAALTAAVSLSACGTSLKDMPLPGSGVSGKTITLTMDFGEALNLAQGAPVKVNGVDAGKVQDITAVDFHARAKVKVRTSAQLRRGATARLRYTTPLGELFVDVTNPTQGTLLHNGEELTTAQTSTAPTVEDALSQASLLINGGGLAQLQTVTVELNKALGGREGTVRDLLAQTTQFVTTANETTHSIDAALTALDSASQTLAARKATINKALKQIKPAADVLRAETPDFTGLLAALRSFSAQANKTVGTTRTDLLGSIQEIEPVLAEFAANKGRWADSLDQLVALGKAVENVVPNDWLNVDLSLGIDPSTLLGGTSAGAGGGSGGAGGSGGSGGSGGPGGVANCVTVPVDPGCLTNNLPGGSSGLGGIVGGVVGGIGSMLNGGR